MKIKTVIIDDEDLSVRLLKQLLLKFPSINVVGIANSVASGVQVIDEEKPDLVFLDINMPGENGFDLLNSFESQPFEVIVVSGSDHAIAAFKNNAVDYLLKPFDFDDLKTSLDKLAKRLSSIPVSRKTELNQFEKIGIPTKNGVLFVKATDIIRCQGISNYTKLYLRSGETITCSKTLLEFERQLSIWNFFRVHKSHLVNLNCITSFTRGVNPRVTMDDNVSLNVSRLNRDGLMRKLSLD